MLDGPASAIFNEMIITQDSRELERISEYDQLANILDKMNFMGPERMAKNYEGYAYMGEKDNF